MHAKPLEIVKSAQVRTAIAQGQVAALREIRAYCVGKEIKKQEVNCRVERLVSRLPVPAKRTISSKLCQLINEPAEVATMSNSILDLIPEPVKPIAIGAISSSIVGLLLVGGSAVGGIKQQPWGVWAGVTGVAFVGSSLGVWMSGKVRSPEQRERESSQDFYAPTQPGYVPTNAHPTYTKLAIACGENIARKPPGPEFDHALEVSERMLGHVRQATTPATSYQTVAFTGYSAPQHYLGESHERISGSADPAEQLPARPQLALPEPEPAIEPDEPAQPLPQLELQDPDLYEDAWGKPPTTEAAHPFQELYE